MTALSNRRRDALVLVAALTKPGTLKRWRKRESGARCPLCAAARSAAPEFYGFSLWWEAARVLGVRRDDAWWIASMADGRLNDAPLREAYGMEVTP